MFGTRRSSADSDGGRWLGRLLIVVLLVAIGLLGWRMNRLERLLFPHHLPAEVPLVAPRADLTDLEKSTTELFRRAASSVAHITTLGVRADRFTMRILEVPQGTGSGFVWDAHGHVVTNYHVLQKADKARVTLSDKSVWPAHLVGLSKRHDLAVLRVPGAIGHGKPLPMGTSHDLSVGQSVAAIGSPFGLDYTLSTGVISGLGREIPGPTGKPISDVIQTDAVINPGNSGGPLLDSSGRLIGVNTSIMSPSGVSAGIGFAVPVDVVRRVVPQLIEYGHEVRPVIGIEIFADQLVRRLGIVGALVRSIVPGSPAAAVGLKATSQDEASGQIVLGDVIVGLDDRKVRSAGELHDAISDHQPGDEVKLTVVRDGEQLVVPLTLGRNVDVGR